MSTCYHCCSKFKVELLGEVPVMDRRSWLWRRKSSEKSPGETESSGSSHSERFYDDQACSNHHSQSPESSHHTQSPEVTSRAAPNEEEHNGVKALTEKLSAANEEEHNDSTANEEERNDSVKTLAEKLSAANEEEHNDSVKNLTEKLSAALLNIRAKEDLVKQNAKVAEEAVSGWEKAESEALALKQQLEAATQKNTALEDRVGHLDGALKECLRELRQARGDQEHKIHEAVAKKTHEWEYTKSNLKIQLVELQSQVQASKGELEIMIIERDLSTKAAEIASKQHLESIKKVAKLESEIRRLKAVARKAPVLSDHKSVSASSVCVESFTDSLSESGLEPNEFDSLASALIVELDQFKNDNAIGQNLMVSSVEINLMDDFLEMERLAALPEIENGSCPHEGESPSKTEFEAMIIRIAEMEEKLEKMETEKVELELALTECQDQLKASRDQLVQAEVKLVELQTCLVMANETRSAVDMKLESAIAKRESAELQLLEVKGEIQTLLSKVSCLEVEVRKEKVLSEEAAVKCRKLEDEILGMKREVDIRNAAMFNGDWKIKQEEELAAAAAKFAECQKTISFIGRQLKSLATMDDFLTYAEKPQKEGITTP
ncbi:filament-like plant protein isoform X3 [Rhododendron vialii]|uniref:filament-like plant protein isoform X3 n=1 Tax=Rhododendron vialii TaxID=182163 RepID=UPI00265E1BE8|nr:filament-like plant protein isoform X3 [Rhododendron vialii]